MLPQEHPTVKHIHSFIHAKGLARVQLKEQDILTLLQTLIADGRYVGITGLSEVPLQLQVGASYHT